jgi:hypothetical protein
MPAVRECPTGLDFGRLMLIAQAPGTEVETFGFTVDINGGRMYIRRPATVGVTLGMADIMPELRCFTAQITLQFSGSPSLFTRGYCKFR